MRKTNKQYVRGKTGSRVSKIFYTHPLFKLYETEIVAEDFINGQKIYYSKWKNWNGEHSWEPSSNFENETIENYNVSQLKNI